MISCARCGRTASRGRGAKRYCSTACRRRAWYERQGVEYSRRYHPLKAMADLICVVCATTFQMTKGHAARLKIPVCRSTACRTRQFRGLKRYQVICRHCRRPFDYWASLTTQPRIHCSTACRRSRSTSIAPNVRRRILRRDNYVCYLCEKQVDRTKKWPHPMSPSVDHVKPRSAGGADDDSNLRCTHWHCNEEKGDQLLAIEIRGPLAA